MTDEQMYAEIEAYAKKIDISFTRGDIEEIIQHAKDWKFVDLRYAVWDHLDTYEGISHTRDLELFPWGDNDYDTEAEYELFMSELEHNK